MDNVHTLVKRTSQILWVNGMPDEERKDIKTCAQDPLSAGSMPF